MVFSHAFAGAALTKLIKKTVSKKMFKKHQNIFYFVGIIAAILPDLDIISMLFDTSIRHRELLSHSLLPYVLISLIIWIISQIKESKPLALISVIFLVGTLSHLFFDYVAGGIALLAPFTDKIYGYAINLPSDPPLLWLSTYMKSKYMIMEFFVFWLYVLAIKKDKNLILKLLPLFLFVVASGMIIVLALFVF
ncbi:metal-dependent hydrolase [candidate division WWE3 bacterium]|jgi:hypothetical protein|nr:metal-dependent hydrolase [candidate division WWE3 bacterium]MBT7349356.1 metal-dependent hydrolase [candidate division WWE3 bacterium]